MPADRRLRHMLIHAGTSGTGMAKEVWAFDFDGVVCDSVGESSLSAWKAAAELWPQVPIASRVSFLGFGLHSPDCALMAEAGQEGHTLEYWLQRLTMRPMETAAGYCRCLRRQRRRQRSSRC